MGTILSISACRSAAFRMLIMCSHALPPAPELFVLQNGEAQSPRNTHPPPSPPALPPALAATILLPVSRNRTPPGPPRSGIGQGLSLPGWLLSRSSVSSGLIHVVAMPGFLPHLRLESVPSRGWTTSHLSTGHLGCFHLSTAVDYAAVNIGVQISV